MTTRLHTVRRGDGPPIVFVHGMGTSAATWERCMGLLADRFTVVAVDLLGHGESPVPDDPQEYTRDRALADLDDVLAHLDDDRRSAFVLTQVLGLHYDEAAEILGCPIGTVRSRVSRARADLVEMMRDDQSWNEGDEAVG